MIYRRRVRSQLYFKINWYPSQLLPSLSSISIWYRYTLHFSRIILNWLKSRRNNQIKWCNSFLVSWKKMRDDIVPRVRCRRFLSIRFSENERTRSRVGITSRVWFKNSSHTRVFLSFSILYDTSAYVRRPASKFSVSSLPFLSFIFGLHNIINISMILHGDTSNENGKYL